MKEVVGLLMAEVADKEVNSPRRKQKASREWPTGMVITSAPGLKGNNGLGMSGKGGIHGERTYRFLDR